LTIQPEDIYNIDKMGVMLSILGCVKVLVDKDNPRAYQSACVKWIIVITIECVSIDGRLLYLLII
jgi:hypothetical protein